MSRGHETPGARTDVHTITLSPVGDTAPCRAEDTVLDAILRSGASVTFGCRGGSCGVCKMRVISGQVEHGRCSAVALLEGEKLTGWFLSCQARALTDLTIELTAANRYRVLTCWQRSASRDRA